MGAGLSPIRSSDLINREPMRSIESTIAQSLTGTGSNDILNVTDRGVLKRIGLFITTAVTGSPVTVVRVTVDGKTATDYTIYNGSTVLATAAGHASTTDTGGNWDNASGSWTLDLDLPFNTSCQVELVRSTGASAGAVVASAVYNTPN